MLIVSERRLGRAHLAEPADSVAEVSDINGREKESYEQNGGDEKSDHPPLSMSRDQQCEKRDKHNENNEE